MKIRIHHRIKGMPRHIGIVACSAEGAALCYRTIAIEGGRRLGVHDHPVVTMDSIPLARHMELIERDDWDGVADLLLESTRRVAQAGADFAICPDNTVHRAFDRVAALSPIPWLHIARVAAGQARERGFSRLAILGTKYLMESSVYPEALSPFGIQTRIPPAADRERINGIIFGELVRSIFREESRLYFNEVLARMGAEGCDAAVLGCTEIPLIVRPEDAPLPTLDSTRLLARAAVDRAADGDSREAEFTPPGRK
jgi:aspartate racemase